ncbi:MAG: ATP-dependent metallopeptidase FtsH/Yme1/Tma family protein [Ruminococcaceae bacterium]|nr:ATP-dependent metallopeptidase FtsH/Yme1/Tma family protein [Oscillospiraceae bacterium]
MKNSVKIIIFYAVMIIAVLVVVNMLLSNTEIEELGYSDIVKLFKEEKVKEFSVDTGNYLNIKTTDGKEVVFRVRDLYLFEEHVGDLIQEQFDKGIITKYNYEAPKETPWWLQFMPYIIVLAVIIFFYIYIANTAMGGKGGKISSFGKARAKMGSDEKKRILFTDVAGADEEKEELWEIVDFLKNPGKYQELGARIPHGVLLVGPPGTGKTLLAKAVAGEAKVPFYSISGSDFVEMYVGVGASRVRDLFDTAKKNSPSIVFIDEIDAVGRHRGAGLGGGHDEREQTLNQLLVEMDGFGSNEGVIVMAATNRPDILDPALLRPGRFDRQVTVNYPDIKGREEILKVHAKGKPFESDVNLTNLAKTTVGFTGADLANILNEAALLAARKGKKLIGNDELEEATLKEIVGTPKKSKVITEKDKKLTAYHEAGHAIVTRFLETQDPVHQISVVPSGRAGGYTLSIPQQDKSYMSKIEIEEEIITLLGGRVAEKLVLNDISTGASNDIERATNLARKMVTQYGMSDDLGPIVYGTGHSEVFLGKDFNNTRNYSEKIAAMIDDEVMKVINKAYNEAERILTEHSDKLHFIAGFLIKNEMMDADQFEKAMTTDATMEEIEQIKADKIFASNQQNEQKREEDRIKSEQAAAEAAASSESADASSENEDKTTKKE